MTGYYIVFCVLTLSFLKPSHGEGLPWQQLEARLEALEQDSVKHKVNSKYIQHVENELAKFKEKQAIRDAELHTQIKRLQDELAMKSDEMRTKLTNQEKEFKATIQKLKNKIAVQEEIINDGMKKLRVTETRVNYLEKAMIEFTRVEPDLNENILNLNNNKHIAHQRQGETNNIQNKGLPIKNEKSIGQPNTKQPQKIHPVALKSMVQESQEHHKSLDDNVIRTNRLVTEPTNKPYAFLAALNGTEHTHLGRDENIKYNVEILNLGDAYNPNLGVFNTSRAGIYLFSATVLTSVNEGSVIYADLMKNNRVLARLHAVQTNGYAEQSTITVVAKLKAGDQVWMKVTENHDVSIWGEQYSFFTGVLIQGL